MKFFIHILLFSILITFHKANAQYFNKITNTPISTHTGDSRSVNWIDVNNDNQVDCFISNGPSGGQNNFLYINAGSGTFSLVTTDSITLDNKPSDGATFSDIDNDGDIDAFVVNWYNVNNLFYLNNGNGNFTKINSQILANDLGYSETAAWGDYDKDGLVDLYVTNSAGIKKNYLYHNNGNANFTKVTVGDLVNDAFFSRNINWVDIDNDADLDVFVTNENNQNEIIYRNDGAGNFTKLTGSPLLSDGGNTNSSSWADIDNDGDLDVFLANDLSYNGLFKNNGNFNFIKIISDTVVKTPARSFSSAWSDVDNDGDLDLFVTNAFANGSKLVNYFYLNDGNGNFSRNTTDIITQDSAWSYGCAFGDYDNDGFEDLTVATCRFNGVDYGDFLYHNNTNSNHWITVKLIGTISNKSAIGTKVKIKSFINGNPVWQMREISSQSSYCGQNDLRVHFGLGNGVLVDSLKIEWPLGLTETYTNISSNQFLTYYEGAAAVNIKESDRKLNNALSIFPNPAYNEITLKLNKQEFHKGDVITLINSQGKQEFQYHVVHHEKEILIKIPKLISGVYFIHLEKNNKTFDIKKLIIN